MQLLYDLLYSPGAPGNANELKIFEIEVELLSATYYQAESTRDYWDQVWDYWDQVWGYWILPNLGPLYEATRCTGTT